MSVLVIATPVSGRAGTVLGDRLVAAVRRREVVLLAEGLRGTGQLLRVLRARLPRFRFVPLVAAGLDPRIVTAAVERGDVPVLALAPGAAAETIDTLLPLLDDAEAPLRLPFEADEPRPVARLGAPAGGYRAAAYRQAVPGGWCARPAADGCDRSAAEGCTACGHFHATPLQLPVLLDVAARSRALDASPRVGGA